MFCDVVVSVPLHQSFTYAIPEELRDRVAVGHRVSVGFGPRELIGLVVALKSESGLAAGKVRSVQDVVDETPVMDARLIELTRFVAEHYLAPWGEVVEAALPAVTRRQGQARRTSFLRLPPSFKLEGVADLEAKHPQQALVLRLLHEAGGLLSRSELQKVAKASASPVTSLIKKKLLEEFTEDTLPDPLEGLEAAQEEPPPLEEDQVRVWEEYVASRGGAFLLKGVTGSGKTEIYLRAIAREITAGRQALVLVPEISLTPQTLRRFFARFKRLAVLHSALTDAQRSRQWDKIRRGEADVVIGARSAIFAPLSRLGLIVVDEEHDTSFKQQSTPRYSARDLALVRARLEGARAILGSATPQLESWWNARKGKLQLLSLPRRAGALPLPPVSVLDMSLEAKSGEAPPLISRKAAVLLAECLKEGKQAMLLMNRRGFSSALSCLKCRAIPRCPGCDIALTVHKGLRRLMCHYCAHAVVLDAACSTCGGGPLRPLGSGTERLEEILAASVPGLRVLRMDADSTRRRGSHQEILDAFRRGEADALLGTQMIAKGHDFPRVSLVVVLDADVGLNLPDFRAGERAFSLITQVAGRAGRKEGDGRVLVQTQHPRNPAIECASRHDVEGFLERESALRKPLLYPPHGRLGRIVLSAPDDDTALLMAKKVRDRLGSPDNLVILGPAPCPLSRIDNESRVHILLKAATHAPLLAALRPLAESPPKVAEAKMVLDVDPINML